MSLVLTDEQTSLVARCASSALASAAPVSSAWPSADDGREVHSPQIAAKLADLGLLGLSIPERYGGSGGDLFDAILFVEAMSRGRAPVPSYPVTLIVAHSYLKFAAEDMKRRSSAAASRRVRRPRLRCRSRGRVLMWGR